MLYWGWMVATGGGDNKLDLEVRIKTQQVKDGLGEVVQSVDQAMQDVADSAQQAGTAMEAALDGALDGVQADGVAAAEGVSQALDQTAEAAERAGSEIDQALADVGSQGRATGEQLGEALGGALTTVSRDAAQAASDVGEAMATLADGAAAAGATAVSASDKAVGAVDQVGDAAKVSAGGMSALAGAADDLAKEMQGLGEGMDGVKNDAEEVAQALDQSFRTLGIRSVQAVEKEVQELQAALAKIRASSDILPADKARAVQAYNDRLAELRQEAGGATRGMDTLAQATDKTAASLASAARSAATWVAALAGLNSIGDVARNVVETGSAFQDLEVRLTSLLGTQEAAQAAFAQLKDLARETPFELEGLADAYINLTAFGLQPTREQMLAIADTAAALGGGTERLQGVTLALGQAWAKGKLQGEEILQLVERGVPAWRLLAEVTGRNEAELQKLSESGALGRDVIRDLIAAMGDSNIGASAELMKTYSGTVAAAKDALKEFYAMIADSGVLDYLRNKLQEVLAEFDRMKESGELQAKARAIADTFIRLAEAASVAGEALSKLSGIVPLLLDMLIAKKVLDFATALRGIGPAAAAAATQVAGANQQISLTTGAAGAATVAATGLSRALGLIKLTGIGLAIDGVLRLAGAFLDAKAAAEAADRETEALMKPKPVNGPKVAADEAAGALAKTADAASKVTAEIVEIGKSSDDAATKIGKIAAAAKDLQTVPGIRGFADGLKQLAAQGKMSADDVQAAWSQAINRMAGEDLAKLQGAANWAFEQGELDARAFAAVMQGTARKAAQDLGLDMAQLTTGISSGMTKSLDSFDALVAGLGHLKKQGVDTGSAIQQALATMVSQSKGQAEIDAVSGAIKQMGEQGNLTKQQVTAMLAELESKARVAAGAFASVSEQLNAAAVAKQMDIRLDQAGMRVALEVARAKLDVAKATGNEREAAEAAMEVKRLEIEMTRLQAQARRAEAEASLEIIKAKRAELQAANQLSAAKKAELDAQEKAALAKQKEATIAEVAAVKMEMLADATERAREATRSSAGTFDSFTESLGGTNDELTRHIQLRKDADSLPDVRSPGSGAAGSGGAFTRTAKGSATLQDIIKELRGYGLDDATAQRIASDFVDPSTGRLPDLGRSVGHSRYATSEYDTWSVALQRAAQEALGARGLAGQPVGDNSGGLRSSPPGRVVVEMGGRSTTINTASVGDQQALMGLFRELESASGVAVR